MGTLCEWLNQEKESLAQLSLVCLRNLLPNPSGLEVGGRHFDWSSSVSDGLVEAEPVYPGQGSVTQSLHWQLSRGAPAPVQSHSTIAD